MELNQTSAVVNSTEKKAEQSLSESKSATKIGFSKTPFLIIIISAFVFGGIGGYILGLNPKTSGLPRQIKPTVQQTTEPQPTSTNNDVSNSAPSSDEIAIIEGSVYKTLSSGEKKILFDKDDFRKNTERYLGQPNTDTIEDPFFSFSQASLSPDKTKMLLLAQGGISIERLYYASVDGSDVIQIGVANEAIWSNDSRYIAYSNKPADAGPIVNVYIYDTQNDKETKLSRNPVIENLNYSYLGFSNLRWLKDDSGIQVNYVAYKGEIPYGEKIGEGETILMIMK